MLPILSLPVTLLPRCPICFVGFVNTPSLPYHVFRHIYYDIGSVITAANVWSFVSIRTSAATFSWSLRHYAVGHHVYTDICRRCREYTHESPPRSLPLVSVCLSPPHITPLLFYNTLVEPLRPYAMPPATLSLRHANIAYCRSVQYHHHATPCFCCWLPYAAGQDYGYARLVSYATHCCATPPRGLPLVAAIVAAGYAIISPLTDILSTERLLFIKRHCCLSSQPRRRFRLLRR